MTLFFKTNLSRSCEFLTDSVSFYSQSPLFSQEALAEVADLTALSTLLLTLLVASLRRRCLSLKYSQLLDRRYPLYSLVICIHFLAAPMGVWVSHAGIREAALLTLLLQLLGIFFEWNVLIQLVFNIENAQTVALEIWRQRLRLPHSPGGAPPQIDTILQYVNMLTGYKGFERNALYLNLVEAMQSYKAPESAAKYELSQRITDLTNIWTYMIDGLDRHWRQIIKHNFFHGLRSLGRCGTGTGAVCASCVLSIFEHHQQQLESGESLAHAFTRLESDISSFITSHPKDGKDIIIAHYLKLSYGVLLYITTLTAGPPLGLSMVNPNFSSLKPLYHDDDLITALLEYLSVAPDKLPDLTAQIKRQIFQQSSNP